MSSVRNFRDQTICSDLGDKLKSTLSPVSCHFLICKYDILICSKEFGGMCLRVRSLSFKHHRQNWFQIAFLYCSVRSAITHHILLLYWGSKYNFDVLKYYTLQQEALPKEEFLHGKNRILLFCSCPPIIFWRDIVWNACAFHCLFSQAVFLWCHKSFELLENAICFVILKTHFCAKTLSVRHWYEWNCLVVFFGGGGEGTIVSRTIHNKLLKRNTQFLVISAFISLSEGTREFLEEWRPK